MSPGLARRGPLVCLLCDVQQGRPNYHCPLHLYTSVTCLSLGTDPTDPGPARGTRQLPQLTFVLQLVTLETSGGGSLSLSVPSRVCSGPDSRSPAPNLTPYWTTVCCEWRGLTTRAEMLKCRFLFFTLGSKEPKSQ